MPDFADRTFSDRLDAGRVLAERLSGYRSESRGTSDVVVLGLARGGVPVGSEIATALHAPLDVLVVRKLGAPQWPELAMGALAGGGAVVLNTNVVQSLRVTDAQVQEVIDRESRELTRREAAYREAGPAADLFASTVILVDDGIATGATMLAAIRAVRTANPRRVIVAVPVGPRRAWQTLRDEADDVVFATMPARFEAVGQAYADFHQISDDEVRRALISANRDER